MSDYRNPLQASSTSAPSIQQPVVNTTGQQIAGFLSDAMNLMTSARPQGPSASEVSEELKTEGSQLAVGQLKRFHEIEKTEGRPAAKRYLNSVVLESQVNMSETSRTAYYGVIKEQLGGSFLAEDEQNRRSIEADQMKTLEGYRVKGAEIAAAQGYNPDDLNQNSLLLLGQMDAGKTTLMARESQELALKTTKLNIADRERLITSNSVYQNMLLDTENSLRAELMGYSQAIQKDPNSRMQLTADLITKLKIKQSSLQTSLATQLSQAGGTLQDISSDQLSRLGAGVDTIIEVIDGTIPLKLGQTEVDRLSVDSLLSFIGSAGNDKVSKAMLVNNAVKVPLSSMNEVLQYYQGGSGTSDVQVAIARSASRGIAGALSNYSVKPNAVKQNYSMLSDVVTTLGTSPSPEAVTSVGETVVNTLWESAAGTSRVRGVANSAYALPTFLSGLAKVTHTPAVSEAINNAALAEGVEPADLWVQSAGTLVREKIVPALRVTDPNYTRNLDIKFEGGRFKVDYKAGFTDTSREFVGNPAFKMPNQRSGVATKQAREMERLLNDYATSYAKVMNAKTEDVGPALEAAVRLSLGLANLQTEE